MLYYIFVYVYIYRTFQVLIRENIIYSLKTRKDVWIIFGLERQYKCHTIMWPGDLLFIHIFVNNLHFAHQMFFSEQQILVLLPTYSHKYVVIYNFQLEKIHFNDFSGSFSPNVPTIINIKRFLENNEFFQVQHLEYCPVMKSKNVNLFLTFQTYQRYIVLFILPNTPLTKMGSGILFVTIRYH